uniref:tyrosine-type recombinase/integrase n=1 Tax=Saccharothrix mutabilis TaxID=33921 RepID=UPI003CD08A03
MPRPPECEPACWTPGQAARFLRWCHNHDDPLADLFKVLIGTGLRKGEALALHWNDIDLDDHVLFVRYTLSNVNNTTPVFTTPMAKTSRTWIGLSDRVVPALRNQSIRQPDRDLVFTRRDGHPLRHEHVLHRFHCLTAPGDDLAVPAEQAAAPATTTNPTPTTKKSTRSTTSSGRSRATPPSRSNPPPATTARASAATSPCRLPAAPPARRRPRPSTRSVLNAATALGAARSCRCSST